MRAVVRALMLERWIFYVLRAEQKPLSNRWLVYPFAFRPSASVCSGADSVCSGNWEGRMSAVCLGALCLTGAASYALTGEKDYARSASVRAFDGARYVSPALCRAVLD